VFLVYIHVEIMIKRGVYKAKLVDLSASNTATATVVPEANSRRLKRSNVHDTADAIVSATEEGTVDPIEIIVEPNDSKRRKNAVAAAKIEPMRKRPKVKLEEEEEIRAVAPPSSSALKPAISVPSTQSASREPDRKASLPTTDPMTTSGPVPDPATSLSNVTALSTAGRSILHIEHRTGKVLGTYKSFFAASKSVGISRHIVESLVKGIYKANHHKGATFRYATIEEEAPAGATRSSRSDIEQIDVTSGNVIATFRSVLAASKETGVGRQDISSILKGELENNNGWTFRLADAILPDVVKSDPPDTSYVGMIFQMNVDHHTKDGAKDIVSDVKTRASARNKSKNVDPGNSEPFETSSNISKSTSSVAPKNAPDAKKAPKVKSEKNSKASVKDAKKPKKIARTDLSKDLDRPDDIVEDSGNYDEPMDYKVLEITVTEHGSLGIMARKRKAPEAVTSLVTLFDGDSDDEMNLCIDSFLGKGSIAEKFGMQVGDFLFPSVGNSEEEERVHGEYKSVAFYIRRNPRPMTFYVVRSNSNTVPSIKTKGIKSSSSIAEEDSLEDMDPMKDMEENSSDYIFHPITITEPGPLGIKVVKQKSLPKGSDLIPYFNEVEGDSYSDYSSEFSLKVESLIGKNPLARKFGLQAGDFLVLPSSAYSPAMYNYQEAFYLDTYEGVRDAIENGERPITLYAIRLKSGNSAVEMIEDIDIEAAAYGKAKEDGDDDSEKDDGNDDESEGSYRDCSGYEGWQKTQKKVVAMAKDFRNWKRDNSYPYDHKRHLKRCQRGIDHFLKVYPPGWPNVDRWECHLVEMIKEYKELTKLTKEDGIDNNKDGEGNGRDDGQEEEDWYDEDMFSDHSDDDHDEDEDEKDEEIDYEDAEYDDEDDDGCYDKNNENDVRWYGEGLWGWYLVEKKVIAMEKDFWQWKKGKNPSYDPKHHIKLIKKQCDVYLRNRYPSGCDDVDMFYRRMGRMTRVYKQLTKATARSWSQCKHGLITGFAMLHSLADTWKEQLMLTEEVRYRLVTDDGTDGRG
jgi:hypothetical protein